MEVQPEANETAYPAHETNPSAPVAEPHPPEHYGPDGELRFPYDRPFPVPVATAPNLPRPAQGPPPPPPVALT